jgi:hypothetical protein
VTGAVPGAAGHVSWLGHLGGLVGGAASGWVFRTRRGGARKAPAPASRPGLGTGGSGPAGGAGSGGAGSGGTGEFQPGAGNPRAELHKELRDLGY